MHGRFRAAVLVVLVWLSTAAAAQADSITFRFEGRVDATTGTVPPSVGDSLFGSVSFDIPGTNAPPGSPNGFFQTRENVFDLRFAHEPGGAAFEERRFTAQLFTVQVFNNFFGDSGGPFDEFEINLSTFTFPQFNFNIDLVDPTGSVFANANLPISPHLDAFQRRTFVASIQVRHDGGQSVVGTFGGTISSLLGGPGPSVVPEPCSSFLLGSGLFILATMKRRSAADGR